MATRGSASVDAPGAASAPALALDRITCTFAARAAAKGDATGHYTAVQDATLAVMPGEFVAVVGPNGSGKTTLFECLGGVLPLDGGTVLQNGRPLTPLDRASALFYLPDGIAPWPSQTVRWALNFVQQFFQGSATSPSKNVRYPAPRQAQWPAPSREEVIEQLDLEPILDAVIGTLSKGQRKRALLAIGLLIPRPILLADEPFEGLDLRQSRDVARTLRSHAAGGRTMFLSIHQIGDAARVCDRFVLLSGGRVCGEGTLPELSSLAAARGATAGDDLEEVFLALT
jgi:ABC-2 type transport system ATP-binding protein